MDSSNAAGVKRPTAPGGPEQNARSRWSREALIAAALVAGIAGLLWRVRSQTAAIHQIETVPVLAAEQTYRQQFAPTIQWGARAPEFVAMDRRAGKRRSLSTMREGASLFSLVFLGGKTSGNTEAVWDTVDLLRRFRSHGFRAALVMERGADQDLPPWLVHTFEGPVLEDPGGRIATKFGLTRAPLRVLSDPKGRVICTESGFKSVAGASWIQQEVETEFLGHADLPRYNGPALDVGRRFPGFTAMTPKQERFDLPQPVVRWTLLAFSSESCRACGGLSDTIAPQIEALRKKGGRTLWIDLTETAPKEDGAPQPGIVELYDPLGSVRRILARQKIPCLCLLDPSGAVRVRLVGHPKAAPLAHLTSAIDRIRAISGFAARRALTIRRIGEDGRSPRPAGHQGRGGVTGTLLEQDLQACSQRYSRRT